MRETQLRGELRSKDAEISRLKEELERSQIDGAGQVRDYTHTSN